MGFDITNLEIRDLQHGDCVLLGVFDSIPDEINNAEKDYAFEWPDRMLEFYTKNIRI